MNQKIVWHPELLSKESLAEFLQMWKDNSEDLAMEDAQRLLGFAAPLLTKTEKASLFHHWFMARYRSKKLTKKEAEQVFEWIETIPKK